MGFLLLTLVAQVMLFEPPHPFVASRRWGRAVSAPDAGTPPPPGQTPMPRISTGAPVFVSEGTGSLLVDGAYRSPNAWTFVTSHCTVGTPCWGAVHVGPGPTQVIVDWSYEDGNGVFDIRAFGGETVANYTLQVSSDSTNGADGTWTTTTTVSGNPYMNRAHLVPFTGMSWVKISITSTTANEIDELDIWDASAGVDGYFFHGDSITTRCANLRGTLAPYEEQPSFQADVLTGKGAYPLQVGGGIVGQGASDASSEIAGYLTAFPAIPRWFFTMGANDLCSTGTYSTPAQAWITAIKNAGATPILVHTMWANNVSSFCSANGPTLNTIIDNLISSNGLLPAVPLYEATVGHPEYFDSGDVHPNSAGCLVWNQTFATYAARFY
jgi:acyl-CoA thioesterase-1